MKSFCSTCPFKPDDSGEYQNMNLAIQVIDRTLFKGHQICHGTEGKKRKARNRCKGAFEHNLEVYQRLGLDHLVK